MNTAWLYPILRFLARGSFKVFRVRCVFCESTSFKFGEHGSVRCLKCFKSANIRIGKVR